MATSPAPAGSIEIRTAQDDDFAPDSPIGYVSSLDYPEGHWVALHLDYETGKARRWSRTVANAETAEALIRADYHRALPRLRDEAAEWAAGFRAAVARAAAENAPESAKAAAVENAWSAEWIAGFRAAAENAS